MVALRGQGNWSWEGPLGTPLGLVQWKRAWSRVEAGTSGCLSISDSDRRVPAELGQERQASSCVDAWNSLAARVVHGVTRHLLSSIWNLRVFPEDARGCQCPFLL